MASQPDHTASNGRNAGDLAAIIWRGVVLSAVFAILVGLAIALDAGLAERAAGRRLALVGLLFVGSSFLGGVLAFVFGTLVSRRRTASQRFSAMMAGLLFFTAAVGTVLYAFHFRTYFAPMHDPFPSERWFYQNLMTMAAAVYQFAAAGLRYLVPTGVPLLFAAATAFSLSAKRFAGDRRN